MSLMSNERELEVLAGYRFQRRVIGVGGRQESTVYAGATVPFESRRGGVQASPSLYLGGATGYASRSHYSGSARAFNASQKRAATGSARADLPAPSMASGRSHCASKQTNRMLAYLSKRLRRIVAPTASPAFDSRRARRPCSSAQPHWCCTRRTPSRPAYCSPPINAWTLDGQASASASP
jgi:hypothetical protein